MSRSFCTTGTCVEEKKAAKSMETQVSMADGLDIINTQLQLAIAAKKCHQCGCFQQTVDAFSHTDAGKGDLASLLTQASRVISAIKYDCLGCPDCYPAIAANAFAAIYPEQGESLDLCPTETPEQRVGWPPLPGDYSVLRYRAPVAVCALNSDKLIRKLIERKPDGLSIVGSLHTENLGIERIIKNTLANPNIRFLLLCGMDTQKAVGHLPGQSFDSLFRNGVDERGRIIEAKGKRPILRNLSQAEVQAFINQVELVQRIGEEDPDSIVREIQICMNRNPGVYPEPFAEIAIEHVQVEEPKQLILDKAGYFVIYPDAREQKIILEHYTNKGFLNCVLEGSSTGALYSEAIARGLLTRLDHAAYLGRELARAENSLLSGSSFIQDAAPGELVQARHDIAADAETECACSSVPSLRGDCC